jgi:hypothetical protein
MAIDCRILFWQHYNSGMTAGGHEGEFEHVDNTPCGVYMKILNNISNAFSQKSL